MSGVSARERKLAGLPDWARHIHDVLGQYAGLTIKAEYISHEQLLAEMEELLGEWMMIQMGLAWENTGEFSLDPEEARAAMLEWEAEFLKENPNAF